MISADEYKLIDVSIANLRRAKRQADFDFAMYCSKIECEKCPMFEKSNCNTQTYLEFKESGVIK